MARNGPGPFSLSLVQITIDGIDRILLPRKHEVASGEFQKFPGFFDVAALLPLIGAIKLLVNISIR
jgi:hypothetical protein